MADRPISELTPAIALKRTDYFLIEQDGEAHVLTGGEFVNWLQDIKGITNITGPVTSGLVDTYTIIYGDNSTQKTFSVTNAKSITNVTYKETSADGNHKTYNVNYNYGNSDTFIVDKGDPGIDLTIVGTPEVRYGKSSSQSATPSTWYASISEIPFPTQGYYIWTRYKTTYNTGSVATKYEIAYQGLDGVGTVNSVNNITADANNNVTITASDISYTPSGSSTSTTVASAIDNVSITVEQVVAKKILIPSATVPIPGNGQSVTITMDGLTADHRLIQWNFSDSAENSPPTDLTWTTSTIDSTKGKCVIVNNGASTSETIQPVFAIPTAKTPTIT